MADKIRKRIAPLAKRLNLKHLIRLSGPSVVFPFYHVVSGEHLPHIRHLYSYRRVTEFEADLEEMLKWFEPISLAEYLQEEPESKKENSKSRRKSKDRREKPDAGKMVLTFDDGLAECHQIIAPVLKKKGVPAVFFLNNHFIDNRGLFFRYKASLIIDRILSDCKTREKAAEFLVIPEARLTDALLMIKPSQQALLDALAGYLSVNFTHYQRESPVYMDSKQVQELVDWGFEIGGHSPAHDDFSTLKPEEMISQVKESVDDLQQRFGVSSRYFSFPFTSHGIPKSIIESILYDHIADVLMGTAGLKKTGKKEFIQRIPIEDFESDALNAIKTEYVYYLLKKPLGRNTIHY